MKNLNRKILLFLTSITILISMPISAADKKISTEKSNSAIINDAIDDCLEVVHKYPNSLSFNDSVVVMKFYEEFDAYYNAATKQVINNTKNRVGDTEPVYVFNKCMAKAGFPFSD